jgi:hypothetical protein
LSLNSGAETVTTPVTIRLPYSDADHDGLVDFIEPAVAETLLTVWRYDASQGVWSHLPDALVLTDVNVMQVTTSELGLFTVLRASDRRVGDVSTDMAFPLPGVTSGVSDVAEAQGRGWTTIGRTSSSPYVVGWDTTIFNDGFYGLRAVCAADPLALNAFEANAAARDNGSDSRCFIATAAYGTPMEAQVQVLRQFRDTYLLPTSLGHWLVEQYYRFSPPLADIIRHHEGLRSLVRTALTPIVWLAQAAVHRGTGFWLIWIGIGLLGSIQVVWALYRPSLRRLRR